MNNLSFRYATKDDSALILKFIKELADYEHMLNEVIATEELLQEWIFEKTKSRSHLRYGKRYRSWFCTLLP